MENMENELKICAEVHRKINSRVVISDEELQIAIKHYKKVVKFLMTINDKIYQLFLVHINSDLMTLVQFSEARKKG